MRPNDKNRIMCPDCGRPKMQFESERKAQDFIKYNADDFENGGESLRAYYCNACCCWHISHKQYWSGYGKELDNKIESFKQQKGNSGKRLDKLIRSSSIEPAVRQAEEIYPQLNLTYQPRKYIRNIINDFLRDHEEYQDSPALRNEIAHLYNIDSRKKKKNKI